MSLLELDDELGGVLGGDMLLLDDELGGVPDDAVDDDGSDDELDDDDDGDGDDGAVDALDELDGGVLVLDELLDVGGVEGADVVSLFWQPTSAAATAAAAAVIKNLFMFAPF